MIILCIVWWLITVGAFFLGYWCARAEKGKGESDE
jgi:hypothetical protein